MALPGKLIKLKPRQILQLAKVFLVHPFYIIPTYRATQKAIRLAQARFGKEHHLNTPANAFRHALWSYLIAQKVYKKNENVSKAVHWAKTITDLHEQIAPNKPLEKAMDLHNNSIGLRLFEAKYTTKSTEQILKLLNKETDQAVKITKAADIEINENRLVFLEN